MLKGKTIYIGRNNGDNKLFAYLLINNQPKGATFGSVGSVPTSVSRAIPSQSKAHASIDIDSSGKISVKNLNPSNVTFVNGSPVMSKLITDNDKVELGSERYEVPMERVLKAVTQIVKTLQPTQSQQKQSQQQQLTFNISHLERVWNDYHEGSLAIRDKQHKMGLQQRIPMFFTLGSGALTSVAYSLGWGEWIKIVSICMTAIGFILMIYFFLESSKFKPAREEDIIREEFQKRYRCPNPACRRFLGQQSYSMMKDQYNMQCPGCKSKFIE